MVQVQFCPTHSQSTFDKVYEEMEVQVLRHSRIVITTCTNVPRLKLFSEKLESRLCTFAGYITLNRAISRGLAVENVGQREHFVVITHVG